MPVVTWSRSRGNKFVYPVHRRNGSIISSSSDFFALGNQTTTSFRTGRKFEDPYEDSTVEASQSGSGLEAYRSMFHSLREEDKVDGDRYDNGHDFSTSGINRVFDYELHLHKDVGSQVIDSMVYPQIVPNSITGVGTVDPATPSYPSAATIAADGRRAISYTIPTAPEAGIAAALAELREGLASLPGVILAKNGIRHRAIGSEYLNLEFGVKPLIRDVEKAAASVLDHTAKIRQLMKNSGTPVRRKMLLYDTALATGPTVYTANPSWVQPTGFSASDYSVSYGNVSYTDLLKSRAYFSGAYSYLISESHSILGKLVQYEQQANYLLGTRITADVIWELTPWSWLLDWQGDLGVFFKNVSLLSSDSTVLRYGYIMHHTLCERKRTQRFISPYTTDGYKTLMSTSTIYRKTRTRSTPYGFGVALASLTSRQWSILGALGLSRSPGTLR